MLLVGFQGAGGGGGGGGGITELTGPVLAGPGSGVQAASIDFGGGSLFGELPLVNFTPGAPGDFLQTGAGPTVFWGPVSAAGGGVVRIRFAVGTAASTSSVTSIPAGAFVSSCFLDVDTPYSAGTTLSIGRTGSLALLMATTDNDPTLAVQYQADQDTAWGASPLPIVVTLTGAPAAGACEVVVDYAVPLN